MTIDAEIPSNPRKDGYAQTRETCMACAIDPPTKKAHENPCCSNPNHQIRPIQINALSKTRLVRSYLTGGKPSGENGSHAHGYRALCRSKERRGPIPFCLCKRRFTSRGNRVRASGREDTTCLTDSLTADSHEKRWAAWRKAETARQGWSRVGTTHMFWQSVESILHPRHSD